MADASGVEVSEQWIHESLSGFASGRIGIASHTNPCFNERPNQPRPSGALMVDSITRRRITEVLRRVSRLTGSQRSQSHRCQQVLLHRVHDSSRSFAFDEGDWKTSDREYLIGPQTVVARTGHMIDVDDIREKATVFVPKSLQEGNPAPIEYPTPGRLQVRRQA